MPKNEDIVDQVSRLSIFKIANVVLKKLDNFGADSNLLLFINAALSIICALSLSVWMYFLSSRRKAFFLLYMGFIEYYRSLFFWMDLRQRI